MLVDKPAGPTSHDMVARVRRALRERAVGHTGTLDPFATGLLVVLVGKATRLARFLEGQDKGYHAVARLGISTDTEDATGTEVARVVPKAWPDREAIEVAMAGLRGAGLQTPPAFSAKQVGGTRSYRLARAGKAVDLAPVAVEVRELTCLDWSPPRLEFRAVVSAGTYVRALARDLGDALGLGGHLTALRRESVGAWRVEDATAAEAVTSGMALIPPAELLPDLPSVLLDPAEAVAVAHGRVVRRPGTGGRARLVHEGRLIAVGEAVPEGWHPVVVLEAA